jgi:hypothetical protein
VWRFARKYSNHEAQEEEVEENEEDCDDEAMSEMRDFLEDLDCV